jgi:hypothetical protein
LFGVAGCVSDPASSSPSHWTWLHRDSVKSYFDHRISPRQLVLFHATDRDARQALATPGLTEIVFVNGLLTDAAFYRLAELAPNLQKVELRLVYDLPFAPETPEFNPDPDTQEVLPSEYQALTSRTFLEFASLPGLRHLHMNGFFNVSEKVMDEFFRSSPVLETLSIPRLYEDDGEFENEYARFFRLAHLCESLRVLETSAHPLTLRDISRCRGLERLRLESVYSDHESLMALSRLTNLRSLTLTGGVAADTFFDSDESMAAILKSNRNLEELLVHSAAVSTGAWLNALRYTPRLRYLNVGSIVWSEVAPEMWSSLTELQNLSLYLGTDAYSVAHLEAIAALPALRSLTFRGFPPIQLETETLRIVLKNPNLRFLTAGFKDPAAAVALLAQADNLVMIDSRSTLSRRQEEQLRKALPNCTIR